MPANLTPDYKAAEERYKRAQSDEERLECLNEMLALIPKHKGTEKLQADIKTRISKLRKQLGTRSGARRSNWYQVEKQGAGQVALGGPPNCGKSAIVASLTSAPTTVAAYPFATVAPQAGMMPFEDIQIQLVDTPPIHDDTEPWVYHILRTADLRILVLDLADDDIIVVLEALEAELARHNIQFRPGREGSVHRAIVVGNKCDVEGAAERRSVAQELLGPELPILAVSARTHEGLEDLRRTIFAELRVIRVYTKRPGHSADMSDPVILPAGSTVLDAARYLHKDFAHQLRYAKYWDGVRFNGQMVERTHVLADRSIVEFHT